MGLFGRREKVEWYDKISVSNVESYNSNSLALQEIAIRAKDENVALKAVEVSTDYYALKRIALGAPNRGVRIAAFQRELKINQEHPRYKERIELWMYEVALASKDIEIGSLALGKISDVRFLTYLSYNAELSNLRFGAWQILRSTAKEDRDKLFCEVASWGRDPIVVEDAVSRLGEKDLQHVILFGKSREARSAAAMRTKDKGWIKQKAVEMSEGSNDDREISGKLALRFIRLD
ncbi:MAG: hypothetical protein KGH78_02385 [Candidatus Micrarchaeota archaeon]|nr:hypothetical protein [Candidatus Micrarchaeota archaeon]